MMAEMHGRLTHACVGQGTGALESIRIESSVGDVMVIKPDAWTDAQAFQEALGKTVDVRVIVTVAV